MSGFQALSEGPDDHRSKRSVCGWGALVVVFLMALTALILAGVAFNREATAHPPTPAPAPSTNAFTPFKPNPKLLVWNKTTDTVIGSQNLSTRIVNGYLTVPLVHDDDNSPSIQLEVTMVRFAPSAGKALIADGTAPLGALFLHCGGPGSDASCAYLAFRPDEPYVLDWTDAKNPVPLGFDVWAISQRGIGSDAQPTMSCDPSEIHLPDDSTPMPAKISDFSNCSCAFLDDTPLIGGLWVDVDPENISQVTDLFAKAHAWGHRCYNSEKFQIKSKDGKRTYNFLDYVGTQSLARDIDLFRQAIGAPKISLAGFSYGTAVSAVYASVYPQFVDRLVINGNMYPMPDLREFTLSNGAGASQGFSRLLENCEIQKEECVLKAPFEAFTAVMDALRSPEGIVSPETNQGVRLKLGVGMFSGYLRDSMSDSSGYGWQVALSTVATLYNGTDEEKEHQVAHIMNRYCFLEGVPTWQNYSVCISPAQFGLTDIPGVLGADLASRYDLEAVLQLINEGRMRLDTPGLVTFLGILAPMFSWPSIPMPHAPMGNDQVAPLVIGNLYDPSTAYRWSQGMASAFPKSHTLTWQGVGHILGAADYDLNATIRCLELVKTYMRTAVLPENGYTCHQVNPIPVPSMIGAVHDDLKRPLKTRWF